MGKWKVTLEVRGFATETTAILAGGAFRDALDSLFPEPGYVRMVASKDDSRESRTVVSCGDSGCGCGQEPAPGGERPAGSVVRELDPK